MTQSYQSEFTGIALCCEERTQRGSPGDDLTSQGPWLAYWPSMDPPAVTTYMPLRRGFELGSTTFYTNFDTELRILALELKQHVVTVGSGLGPPSPDFVLVAENR